MFGIYRISIVGIIPIKQTKKKKQIFYLVNKKQSDL